MSLDPPTILICVNSASSSHDLITDAKCFSVNILNENQRLIAEVFAGQAGISDWEQYIESDPRFKRPAEVHALHGSYAKAKEKLGWEPKTSFKDMVVSMVNEDIKRLSNDLR